MCSTHTAAIHFCKGAVVFLEVEEGGQDRDEESVKVYLIKFIADLPLRLVYTGCVIESL